METAPRNCRFLSLVVVELVLKQTGAAARAETPHPTLWSSQLLPQDWLKRGLGEAEVCLLVPWKVTLPALQKHFVNTFLCLPGNFVLKHGGDFWWIFSGLSFPQNEARKILQKFGENSEQNSGQNPGREFEKFGELSFCSFSDLMKGGIVLY